jgi:hypothetical protein
MRNRHKRRIKRVAAVIAVLAIAVYVRPAWTGEVYLGTELAEKALGFGPCVPGDEVAPWNGKGAYIEGEVLWKNYDCYEIRMFSSRSLPLAGVLGFSSLMLLLFSLQSKTKQRKD